MRNTLIAILVLAAAASVTAVGAYARNCSIYNATPASAVVTPSATMEPTATQAPGTASYQKITAEQAKARMDSADPVVIVDVRTPEEFATGHVPGAINVPNEEILDQMPEQLPDADAEILVYCRSGRRSKEAANKLIEMGYTNVYDFGGIIDWPYNVEA